MLQEREIDPAIRADIEKFEVQLERYLSGELEEDVFRVFRLNNGIYGQRQGGHHQMVRVKVPYGSITPEQLDMMGHVADDVQPGLGSHHDPPERPVPLRAARADPCGAARPGLGRPHDTARRAATPCATSRAATSPAPAPTRSSTSAPGPRPPSSTSCATRSPSGCPASSRSTSRAATPTAARRCSTTSA